MGQPVDVGIGHYQCPLPRRGLSDDVWIEARQIDLLGRGRTGQVRGRDPAPRRNAYTRLPPRDDFTRQRLFTMKGNIISGDSLYLLDKRVYTVEKKYMSG
jgi:hypothetical protein